MQRPSRLLMLMALCLAYLTFTHAFRVRFGSDAGEERKMRCAGMYASSTDKDGNSKNDSDIRVVMDRTSKGYAAIVVFEWDDANYVGKPDKYGGTHYICDSAAVRADVCAEANLGQAIIDASVPSTAKAKSLNFANELDEGAKFFDYVVEKTGFYCVIAWPIQVNDEESEFTGLIHFRNKHGELRGTDYPKLVFYGILSLIYSAIGIAWMVLCAKHWREISAIQHFISGVIFFLMVEMAFNWGHWEHTNNTGVTSIGLLVVVSILNSARISISLFMLLIVSMGYGVVRPTLGSTMKKCIFLAVLHFVFGVIYSAGTMSPVESASTMIILIVVIPLALTMTCFYVWILQSLRATIATLTLRRQTVKMQMYQRLWRLLVFSVMALCGLLVVDTLTLMNMNSAEWLPKHWRTKWFLLDGWLNLLYLVVFSIIVFLWRPTDNNKRYDIDQLETEDYDHDEHADHNNARAAESMGLTGMKLRPNRRDYEDDDDQVAMFDIGDEEDEEDDEDDHHMGSNGGNDQDDIETGRLRAGSPSRTTTPSIRSGANASPILNAVLAEETERERMRLEISKMN
ncbi:hypothetical protein BGW42_005910 [Actinomortierella wolfii]|nr:hypothetical protein BGW42_005910 [Actinomortierella wolfii]